MKKILVQKDSYHDSVFLMQINTEIKKIAGVKEAVVSMGTEMNLDLLKEMGLSDRQVETATANDLIIAVEGETSEAAERAIRKANELLWKKKGTKKEKEYRPPSLDAALNVIPQANMAIISLPGEFAAREARKALNRGLHVMLFSDNVSLEEEIELKRVAREKGLLMMGPDCGTAIINGKPLCFANVVRRGDIGIVAASGTGLQEVTCLINRFGKGISQAIGTGGRDLKNEKAGGTMMLMGIEALQKDHKTRVIVVISKPPSEKTAERVVEALKKGGKPAVIHFIGLESGSGSKDLLYAENLEETARIAVALAAGNEYRKQALSLSEEALKNIIERETEKMSSGQKYIRGLFTGGTLADEAIFVLEKSTGEVYSNIQTKPKFILENPHISKNHTIIDLGDDVFTVGRPHPMIDPSTRIERIGKEAEDPEVALLLLDVMLGYGSHPDPAGAMVESIVKAKDKAGTRGGYLSVIASITGTEMDFQNLEDQRNKLESAGCVVMPSNFQASVLASRITERIGAK